MEDFGFRANLGKANSLKQRFHQNCAIVVLHMQTRCCSVFLAFQNDSKGSMMKKFTALITATLLTGAAFAQAPVTTTTRPNGTASAPATKSDVNAAAKVEKAEIKANEKIEKATADAAQTSVKADAKAAKTKARAEAKANKKILAAKKDVAKAQVDANTKVEHNHADK